MAEITHTEADYTSALIAVWHINNEELGRQFMAHHREGAFLQWLSFLDEIGVPNVES